MLAALGGVLLSCPALHAGGDRATVSIATLRNSTIADYTNHLRALQSLAAACGRSAAACDPAQVGADEHVTLAGQSGFDAHYAWVADALNAAKTLPDAKRTALMATVAAHLEADLADARPSSVPDFAGARRDANAILAGSEFNTSTEPSLRDRIIAFLYRWLDRLLSHVVAFGSRSPWVGPLIEWALGALAGALLLVWAFRIARRQRGRMRFEADRRIEQTEERVMNWMREAEQHAAAGRFRDAVHCLYWASIVSLEGRRLWQPDRARTPREYLRLLDPAARMTVLLRRQTFSFETIWYGLRPAARLDYDSALDLHRELRSV